MLSEKEGESGWRSETSARKRALRIERTAANFNAPRPGQRRLAKEPSQRKQQTDRQTNSNNNNRQKNGGMRNGNGRKKAGLQNGQNEKRANKTVVIVSSVRIGCPYLANGKVTGSEALPQNTENCTLWSLQVTYSREIRNES